MIHTLTIDGYPIGRYETPDPMIEHLIIEAPAALPEPMVEWPLDFDAPVGATAHETAAAILSGKPAMYLID